jgi:hypothetical protein
MRVLIAGAGFDHWVDTSTCQEESYLGFACAAEMAISLFYLHVQGLCSPIFLLNFLLKINWFLTNIPFLH